MRLNDIDRLFPTEDACKTALAKTRWPDKVHCPRCGLSLKVYALKARPYHWVCKSCAKNGYRFSVLTGTIFENTNAPLRTWFKVIYLMTTSKKGISAMQVQRMIDPVRGKDTAWRTAWYMCHRIRAAMKDETFRRLSGVVEMDETLLGGSLRNRPVGERKRRRKLPYLGKTPVIGAIARKGNVVAKMVDNIRTETVDAFVQETVADKVSLVATDDATVYRNLDWHGRRHEAVDHSKGEYVRGRVHTANLDSFWSLLKRGVVGTYHQVSKKYLPLYLNEFSFRHNHRNDPNIFNAVVAGC